MKRITILLDEALYRELVDYTADVSKREVEKMNMSEVVRDLLESQLKLRGYGQTKQSVATRQN